MLQDEPTIEFLNDLKFDVGTIGNHEFDEGIDEMKRLIYGGYHEKTGNFKGANFLMSLQTSIINPLAAYFYRHLL